MEELHIFIELNASVTLNCMPDLQCITWFEQYRGVVNKLTVKYWINTDHVFIDLRLDLMSNIVVYWITHIFWKHVFKAFLIEHVVIKYFN